MYIELKRIIMGLLILASAAGTPAQDNSAIRKQQFNVSNGSAAIKGYDPVAYLNEHKAVQGKKEWSIVHQGILYYFSSAQNKELFKKSPTAYEPQYGGWCAYAMGASAEKVTIDPQTFKILNGKLFLFYNKYFTNTLTKWNKDEQTLHAQATANWIKIFH